MFRMFLRSYKPREIERMTLLAGKRHTTLANNNRQLPGIDDVFPLPTEDNTPEGLQALLTANAEYRSRPWPPPFDTTFHTLRCSDARDLSWIPSESVHLVVTSPPYWILKKYKENCEGQLGDLADCVLRYHPPL
jgi:hypothetical protein